MSSRRRLAMDAEQKRDSDGKFGSGGSSSHSYNEEAVNKAIGSAYRGQKPPSKKQRSVTHALLKGNDSEPPSPASMQGEAGRQARKQARDCMSGRFRQ